MKNIKTIPVDVVETIRKADFVAKYYKPQRPVLIKNLTRDWPAYKKWNLTYIQSLAGDQVVPLYNNVPTKVVRLYRIAKKWPHRTAHVFLQCITENACADQRF